MRSRALLLLGSTVLSLLSLEAAVRLAGWEYSALEIEVAGTRTDWRRYHAFELDYFAFDAQQIWKPRPGLAVFNAQGYRGPELGPTREPGEWRILAVGDSNTLGWPHDPTNWAGEVGNELRAAGWNVRVINGGVWGHSSYQGRARLAELLPLEPDVVLISYGANDAHPVRASDAAYVERIATTPGLARLGRFGIGQLILRARDAWAGRSDPVVRRVDLEDFVENHRAMVAAARDAGATPYLMTRPFFGTSSHPLWWKREAPRYAEATRQLGAELGVPVIDLRAEFLEDEAWFADESHLNEAGHRHAARRVAARLEPELARRSQAVPPAARPQP